MGENNNEYFPPFNSSYCLYSDYQYLKVPALLQWSRRLVLAWINIRDVPIKEDSTSITYMQRTRMYKYRCCKKCNKTEKLMSTSNKFLYYTGTALIGIGFFIQTIILFIGVGCIFLAILAPFIIAKVSGRKYGVDYERVIKSGALIDEKKTM